jgi:20S proteasome subunit alpha 6
MFNRCIQGKEHAVLATLNRTQAELSSTLKKMFKVDDHMGIAMSGVTADGRIMSRYMRNECLNHR